MSTLTEKIRYNRKVVRDMSQTELGKLAFGLGDMAAQSKVSRIEKGSLQPTIPELQALERTLEIKEGELVELHKQKMRQRFGVAASQICEAGDSIDLRESFKDWPEMASYVRILAQGAQSKDFELMKLALKRLNTLVEASSRAA